MKDLITRFLVASRVDLVFFMTAIVDVIAVFLWSRLKGGLPEWKRSLFKAVIFIAMVLTVAALCKYFGIIKDWKELKPNWTF